MKLSFKAMRFLDLYVGNFLLHLLVYFIPLIEATRPIRHKPEDVRCVLIQKYFGIGSIVNAIPMLESVRAYYPNAKIVFATFAEQASLFDELKLADQVILIDRRNVYRFFNDTIRAIISFWKIKPDVSIDIEFFARFSTIMAGLSGARERAGFAVFGNPRDVVLTHPCSFNHYHHVSRAFSEVSTSLGVPIKEQSQLQFPSIFEKYRANIEHVLDSQRPLFTINVNASSLALNRVWPLDNFVDLVNKIAVEWPSVRFLFIGSRDEIQYVKSATDQLKELGDRVVNVAGKTSLGELMALLEKSGMFITNDSGPAHLAAGFSIPEIVLFGPETPILYKPLNKNCRVIARPPYCSPCLNVLDNKRSKVCHDPICMKQISVDDILFEIRDILKGSSS